MSDLIDHLVSFFTQWPALDRYTAIGIGVSTLGVLLTIYSLRGVKKVGYDFLEIAQDKLKHHIISRVNQPDLMTPTSLRALALGIQNEMKCPALTDAMLVTAVRAAALEIEAHHKGATLLKKLRTLNTAMLGIDETVPPLLSIAMTDRILAYVFSMRWALYIAIFLQVLLTILTVLLPTQTPPLIRSAILVIMWAFATLYVWLALSNIRAVNYWRGICDQLNTTNSLKAQLFTPKRVHPIFDFYLYNAHSTNYRFLNVVWAPIWEGLFMVFRVNKFVDQHEIFNWYKVDRLRKRFDYLYNALVGLRIPSDKQDLEEFISICRELWVMTGSKRYRELEEKAKALLSPAKSH